MLSIAQPASSLNASADDGACLYCEWCRLLPAGQRTLPAHFPEQDHFVNAAGRLLPDPSPELRRAWREVVEAATAHWDLVAAGAHPAVGTVRS